MNVNVILIVGVIGNQGRVELLILIVTLIAKSLEREHHLRYVILK